MASILDVLKMVPTICEEYGYDEPQVLIVGNMIRTLGTCSPSENLIRLSEQFIEQNDINVVKDLLKHEIAHLKFANHGTDFIDECHRMGIEYHTHIEHPNADYVIGKYKYQCPKCGKVYGYGKRLKNGKSCGECSNGVYNNQFKLRLIS